MAITYPVQYEGNVAGYCTPLLSSKRGELEGQTHDVSRG